MKNIFNNPWFVGICILMALLMLGKNVVLPLLGEEDFSDSEDPGEYDWLDTPPEVAEIADTGRIELKSVMSDQLRWNEHPRRDPFSQHIKINSSDVRVVQSQANLPTDDIMNKRPVLSALVAGERSRLAVIDGAVVREGDGVSGFLVKRIVHNGVWMYSPEESFKLDWPGLK